MLDMFGLDSGLKAQSLSKVVFSEMRDSQMGKTNFFTDPKPTKPTKPTFCRLWGFMLDAFEVDGGLTTESLWKVCFIGFIGSGTTQKLVSPRKSQHFQSGTYKTLVLVYMLLLSEKRDSRNTFGLECGLNSQGHWEVGFVGCFGSDSVKQWLAPNSINIQVWTSVLWGKSNVLLPCLAVFFALCDENQLFHRSQTNKTNKTNFL